MYAVKQCGVKVKPPSLVVTYVEKSSNKMRCRTIPVRNFKANSNTSRAAEEIKNNQRHRSLLSGVSQLQIEKMLLIIQGSMNGKTLEAAIAFAKEQLSIDPDKDLNKVEESEVAKAKLIMDETFERNRIKMGDDEFQYDVEVDFDQGAPIEASGWDTESDNDEF